MRVLASRSTHGARAFFFTKSDDYKHFSFLVVIFYFDYKLHAIFQIHSENPSGEKNAVNSGLIVFSAVHPNRSNKLMFEW